MTNNAKTGDIGIIESGRMRYFHQIVRVVKVTSFRTMIEQLLTDGSWATPVRRKIDGFTPFPSELSIEQLVEIQKALIALGRQALEEAADLERKVKEQAKAMAVQATAKPTGAPFLLDTAEKSS